MTGLRWRLAFVAALMVVAVGLWMRYLYLERALEREQSRTQRLRTLRQAERDRAEARIFSVKELAKLRRKEKHEAEINLSRGRHVFDF